MRSNHKTTAMNFWDNQRKSVRLITSLLLLLLFFCILFPAFSRTTEQLAISDDDIAQYPYPGSPAFLEMVFINGRPASPQEFQYVRIIRQGRQFNGQPGMLLYPQDIVITGPGIWAIVVFSPATRMAVLPDSQCEILIESTRALSGKFFVWLSSGTMYSWRSGGASSLASSSLSESISVSRNSLLLASLETPPLLPPQNPLQLPKLAQWWQDWRNYFAMEFSNGRGRNKRTQFFASVEHHNNEENVTLATWKGVVEMSSRWNYWKPVDVNQFQQIILHGPQQNPPVPTPLDPIVYQDIITTITLLDPQYGLLSRGQRPIQVPNVTGWQWPAAAQYLNRLGFPVVRRDTATNTAPQESVISQYPYAGMLAFAGSTITLDVAKGVPCERPTPPTLVTPVAGGTLPGPVVGVTWRFDWEESKACPGRTIANYQIEVIMGGDAPPGSEAISLTVVDTTVQQSEYIHQFVTTVAYETQGYWRVRAMDNQEALSEWSERRNFDIYWGME